MNDAQILILVLVGVAAAVAVLTAIGFWWSHHKRIADLNRTYARLAQGCDGRVTRGNSFKRPTLSFQRHGANVFVDTWTAKRGECLQVHIDWPVAASRMTINPRRLPAIIGRLIGIADVRIGDRAFDRRYTVAGNDEQAIREMLSPSAREFIDALQNLAYNEDLYVGIHGGRYVVQKLGRFHEFEELVQFISLAVSLYEHLLRGYGAGIEIIEPFAFASETEDERQVNDVVCQVCGGQIRSDVVFCRSCRTPHHLDCWDYNGVCSTYGCRQTRCVPGVAGKRQGVASK